jgi:hypothetical protein
MARAAVVLCALLGASTGLGCSDNPYVIGRGDVDAGLGECAGKYANAVLCSGFERRDVAADWSDTTIMAGGTLERTTQHVHRGHGALHASSTAPMSVAVVAKTFTPVSSGALYLRAYVFVPAGLPTETMNIFFLGFEPMIDPFQGVDFNLESGAVQTYSPQGHPERQTGKLTIPRDRWFCFRARVTVSADHGGVRAFVGDAGALDAGMIDTLPEGGVREFRAGIDWSSDQTAFFEIYMDDIVLDHAPVPCG